MKESVQSHSVEVIVCSIVVLFLLVGFSLYTPAPAMTQQSEEIATDGTDLTVYCFSAGKADAFLLMTAHGTVLIDAGEKGFGGEILQYLEEEGIKKIDFLIISHFDQDHVGGAAKVINNIPVGIVLQSNNPKDSTEYEKYVKALKNASIEPVTVRQEITFVLDQVVYKVNPPRKNDYQKDDSNNSSLIVSVFNGEDSFLFMGDAETERIEEFLDAGCTQYDLLKVPHHGQEEERLETLLQAVRPQYAVITSSDLEPESEAVLSALKEAGTEVFLTCTAPVVITSDGSSIQVCYEEEMELEKAS